MSGITVLGRATEEAKLTVEEQRQVMAWTAEDAAGRIPMGVIILGASVAKQVSMAHTAEHAGADWLILQSPPVGA